jgi:multiple sugar transport system substrate-binding protein
MSVKNALHRRTLLAGAAAVAGTASLAVAPRARAADPVTLKFWASWSPSDTDYVQGTKLIQAYQQANPGVRIDMQSITFDALHDKLITAVAGGDAPDLSWGLAEWLGELTRMNALADLTERVAAWPDHGALYPDALRALTVDGKLRALPNYIGLRAMLYHADMLKAANVAPPKTWADLLAAAPKITAATGKPAFGIAGTGVRAPQELLVFLAQNDVLIARPTADGKYRNTWAEDKQEHARAAEVFAFYQTLQAKGVISPDAKGWGWQEEDTDFSLGQFAMVTDGAWMQSYLTQNPKTMADVVVAPPPYARKPATFFEVNPFFVFRTSAHPQETWDFASYMLGTKWQAACNPGRSVRMDVVRHDQWGEGFTSLAPTGVVFPPVALGGIVRAMQDSIGHVLLRNETPDATATWLSDNINHSLKRSGELGAA